MKIIDIAASCQGFVHWPLLAESVDGVILKAADGHYEDVSNSIHISYTDYRIFADRYAVPIFGVYGWWYPPTAAQSIKSMSNVLYKLAGGAQMILDLELKSGQAWQSGYKQNVIDHLDALDQLGGKATIAYLGAEMLGHFVNPDGTYPAWITKRPLWWAQYPYQLQTGDQWDLNNYAFQHPTNIPKNYPGKVDLWQFSGNGVIVGIPGNSADLNTDPNIPVDPTPPAPPTPYPAYKVNPNAYPNVRSLPGGGVVLGQLNPGDVIYVDRPPTSSDGINFYLHFQPTAVFTAGGWVHVNYVTKA